MNDIVGVIGSAVTLVLLMILAYKGFSVLVIAPILGMLVALVSGNSALVYFNEAFMVDLANFIKANFPVFLTGAIFGKLMGVSGASSRIADVITKGIGEKRAILAVVVSTAILVYGGVSLFVVVFAIYPIAVSLFKKGEIPKRFLPATIALGAFTFAMTAMPGSPQVINTIPISYFQTTIYSAPILGIVATLIMAVLGTLYLTARVNKAKKNGEGYGNHKDDDILDNKERELPSFMASIFPILFIFISNFILTNWYFVKFKYLYMPDLEKFGQTNTNGTWPVIISLSIAIVLCLILFRKYIKNPNKVISEGANSSLLPVLNTAAQVGYGGVIKAVPAFTLLKTFLIGLPLSPLFLVAVSTTLLAGIVGSSSGGLGIALGAFAETFKNMAIENGIDLGVIHRIAVISAGGLDTFPHCGAIITLLTVTKLTHKESYKDIAVCTMGIPLIATLAVIILALFGVK